MTRDQKLILLCVVLAAVVSIALTAAGIDHGVKPPPGWEEPRL